MLRVSIIAILAIPSCLLASDSAIKQRFLAEYEPAVNRAISLLCSNRHAVVREKTYENGKVIFENEYDFLSDREHIIASVKKRIGSDPNGSMPDQWAIFRPDGTYLIEPSQKAGEYVLKNWDPTPQSAGSAGPPFSLLVYPLMRLNHFLVAHIKKSEVVVLKLNNEIRDNSTVRVLKVAETINNYSFDTTYIFDSSDEWLLQSFEIIPGDGSDRVLVTYSYRQLDGATVPERARFISINQKGEQLPRFELDYVTYGSANPRLSDFSLSRFGLPESQQQYATSGIATYWWVLAASVILAGLALLFRILATRRSTTSS